MLCSTSRAVRRPVVAPTFAIGDALANGVQNGPTGVPARFKIDRRPEHATTENVIAETRRGDPNNVVVVGAHLDSVGAGPGINDNGSGSAGILEIAEQLRERAAANKMRFIWFSAEESGLLGSESLRRELPTPRSRRRSRRC